MDETTRKIKSPEKINIHREECRKLILASKLHGNHKAIIMRMTDYVNRHCYEAFVGEKRLADDCNTTVRSVRRAKAAAFKLDLIECTQKGNRGINGEPGHASRYKFKVERQDISSSVTFKREDTCGNREDTCDQRQDTHGLLTPEISPEVSSEIVVAPPSSSGLDGHSSGVASPNSSPNGSVPSGARSATQKEEEGRPMKEGRPKQTREQFLADMACAGIRHDAKPLGR
jgi:hypothetical protein